MLFSKGVIVDIQAFYIQRCRTFKVKHAAMKYGGCEPPPPTVSENWQVRVYNDAKRFSEKSECDNFKWEV